MRKRKPRTVEESREYWAKQRAKLAKIRAQSNAAADYMPRSAGAKQRQQFGPDPRPAEIKGNDALLAALQAGQR